MGLGGEGEGSEGGGLGEVSLGDDEDVDEC